MEPIVHKRKPTDQWLNNYISPGRIGNLGDVNLQVKLRKSMPDLPQRFSPWTAGYNEEVLGSNVQDGQMKSFDSGGLMARVIDRNWDQCTAFKVNNGWIYQDLRVPDKRIEPYLGATPQYGWLNQVASIYNAKTTGNKFLPAPGNYAAQPGDVPRGGALPKVYNTGDAVNVPSGDKGNYKPRQPTIFT